MIKNFGLFMILFFSLTQYQLMLVILIFIYLISNPTILLRLKTDFLTILKLQMSFRCFRTIQTLSIQQQKSAGNLQ